MKKALILADYAKDTGIGHLMRCRTLAAELASDFEVVFVRAMDEHLGFVSSFVAGASASVVTVNNVASIGREVNADILIVDSYKASSKFLTMVKNSYELCAVIDDNMLLSFYDADFIINQNIGAEKFKYSARKDTELLLGSDYIMLREGFSAKTPPDVAAPVENIIITTGNSDDKNTTVKLLKYLEKYDNYTYDVVVGGAFKNTAELARISRDRKNVVLHHNPDIPKLFGRCQGAISACGSTIYELSAMGIPTIGVVTADNQINASAEMENNGLILSAGIVEKMSRSYFDVLFKDAIENVDVRKKIQQSQLAKIKTGGSAKIKEALLKKMQ